MEYLRWLREVLVQHSMIALNLESVAILAVHLHTEHDELALFPGENFPSIYMSHGNVHV